jgi:hypothetical protein
MAVFTAERTARKEHRCWRCGGAIKAGKRYAAISITPGGEMGYLRWSRLAEHLSYAECDYELTAKPAPDVPDWLGGSDWPETPVAKEA